MRLPKDKPWWWIYLPKVMRRYIHMRVLDQAFRRMENHL